MNLHKRMPLYSVGLLLTSLGIVLITKADIGIAPVSTLPYALSLVIPQITLGTFMTFMHLACMLAQLAILRRMTPALVRCDDCGARSRNARPNDLQPATL